AQTGMAEDNVVHELFHLKLRHERWPVLSSIVPSGPDAAEFTRDIQGPIQLFHDGLLHRRFYRQMKAMGFDPSRAMQSTLDIAMKAGDFSPRKGFGGLVLFLVKYALDVDDADHIGVAFRWFQEKGWTDQLQTAKKALDVLAASSYDSPEKEIETLVEMLRA